MDIIRIGKNTLIYTMGIVTLRATAFFLIPLYTHFMSMEDFGILSTILITIQLMNYIMPLGTLESVCKYFDYHRKNNQLSALFGTSVLINMGGGILISFLALTIFLPLLNKYIPSKDCGKYILLACFVSLAQSMCLHMMSYYRAENKAFNHTLTGTLSSVLILGLTIILVVIQKRGIAGALYAQAISYTAAFILVFIKLINSYKFKFSSNMFKELILFGHPLVISSLSMFVIQSSGIYFLGYLGTMEDTAIYSLANKFSVILHILIIAPFRLAFAPYFYSHDNNPAMKRYLSRILIYLITIPMLLAALILFFVKIFFPLIAPIAYFPSYTACLFLMPGILFLSINIIGETILNYSNKTSCVGLISFLCAALNLILNYFLVSHFKFYGAVASSSITMILMSIMMFWFGWREYPFLIRFQKAIWILALLTVTLLTYFFIKNSNLKIFIGVGLLLLTGIIVFLARSNIIFDKTERIQIQEAVVQLGREWKSRLCRI